MTVPAPASSATGAVASPRRALAVASAALALVAGLAACGESPDDTPVAEFVVLAGDSAYWVRGEGPKVSLQGSPMVLAQLDGQFRELYVVDDDHSFETALFVGQRLFQRDLVSGDSTEIFRDTLVPALADQFERANPEARRLGPEEDTAEEPATSATAEVSVLGVHGPFLSLEYHADTAGAGDDSWHMTRHAVFDLRTNRPASLADVLGAEEAGAMLARARRLYRETVDSIRRDRRPEARRAARSLGQFRFDTASFALTAPNGTLMVAFSAPGQGVGGEGFTLPMRPLPVNPPAWWTDARAAVPTSTREREELWSRGRYTVKAVYDTVARPVQLSIVDSAGAEHPVGRVSGPVHRIYWLDQPPIGREQRSALRRAFDEAAAYDGGSARASRDAALPTISTALHVQPR